MEDIYNLTKEQISELLEKNSFPKYRASQLWRYLYKNDVNNFEEMSNISTPLIHFLKMNFFIGSVKEIRNIISWNYFFLIQINFLLSHLIWKNYSKS